MYLAFSTSTLQFGAAVLLEDGMVSAEYAGGHGRKNFQGFMPIVDFLMESAGNTPEDIEGIIVSTGPGSFTGLRVGLAAAKGMAQALEVPVVGVSSLAALARRVPFSDLPVRPLIDSRKGEHFSALFQCESSGRMIRLEEDICIREDRISGAVQTPTLFIGNDYRRQGALIRSCLGDRARLAPPAFWHPSASSVGALGLERLRNQDSDDLRDLVPVYFRPPDIRPGPFQKPPAPNDPRFQESKEKGEGPLGPSC